MIYSNVDEKRKEILKQAEHLRQGAASMHRLKPLIRSFNGKVYNCRFDNAVADLSSSEDRFYVSNHYGNISIEWNARAAKYSDSIHLLFAYGCKGAESKKDRPNEKLIIFDGKKIIADKMIALLDEKRESLLKEAYTLENAAECLDETLRQIESTRQLFNKLVEAVPDKIKSICGLKYYY